MSLDLPLALFPPLILTEITAIAPSSRAILSVRSRNSRRIGASISATPSAQASMMASGEVVSGNCCQPSGGGAGDTGIGIRRVLENEFFAMSLFNEISVTGLHEGIVLRAKQLQCRLVVAGSAGGPNRSLALKMLRHL